MGPAVCQARVVDDISFNSRPEAGTLPFYNGLNLALFDIVSLISICVALGGAKGERSSSWLHGLLRPWFAMQACKTCCLLRVLVFYCAYTAMR